MTKNLLVTAAFLGFYRKCDLKYISKKHFVQYMAKMQHLFISIFFEKAALQR